MKSSHRLIVLSTSASLLLLAGCTAAPSDTGDASTDTIRVTLDIPASFDPAKANTLPDYTLARASYDTLVRRGDAGLVGGLASSWDSTPTSATFTLRDGATCADGTAITPDVVKNSLDYTVVNGGTFGDEVFGPGNAPVVTADDAAGSVTVTVQTPWPDLVTGLSVSGTGIICPAGLADPEGLNAGTVKGAESGPYVLTSAEPGVSYTYELRDDYDAWPSYESEIPGVAPRVIKYVVTSDGSATSNLLLSGQLDVGRVFESDQARFENDSAYTTEVLPFGEYFVVFNEQEGAVFADPAKRKAVAQLLNVDDFQSVMQAKFVTPWMVAPGTACAEGEPQAIALDTDAASAVLKGVDIKFVGATVVGQNGVGNDFIQEQLRAAGANVVLSNVDIGSWAGSVFGAPDQWDLTVYPTLNFVGTMASPLALLTGPSLAKGGGNPTSTVNDAARSAFAEGLAATSDTERCAAYRDSAQALISAADAVPLTSGSWITVSRAGFAATSLGGALEDTILRITD